MSPNTRLALIACVASLVVFGGSADADVVVVPNALTAAEGNGANQNPFNNAGATAQLLISASQLSDFSAGDMITGLRFRLNENMLATPSLTVTWSDYEITLAELATSVASPSLTYATNMTNPVLVRDGGLTFAVGSFPGGASPNAFGPLLSFNLSAYAYQGGDLVVLLSHTANNGPSAISVDSATSMASGYGTDFRTLLASSFQATAGVSTTGSFPVVQFEFAPVPEASSWLFGCAALTATTLAARLRRKSAT